MLSKEELNLKVGNQITIAATVTEEETNHVETDNGKIDVIDKLYNLDFSKSTRYFQPGLPYHGKLRITNKIVPIREEVIEICYNIAIRKPWNIKKNLQCSNFTLFNDESIIDFYILPLKEHTSNIFLYVWFIGFLF